jgi:hypothetical protein
VLDSGSNEKCFDFLSKASTLLTRMVDKKCLLLSVRLDTTAVFGAIDLRMFLRKGFYDGH